MSFCPCIYTKDKNKKKNKKWEEGFVKVEEGKIVLYSDEKRKLFSFKGAISEEMECLYYLIFMENVEDVAKLKNGYDDQERDDGNNTAGNDQVCGNKSNDGATNTSDDITCDQECIRGAYGESFSKKGYDHSVDVIGCNNNAEEENSAGTDGNDRIYITEKATTCKNANKHCSADVGVGQCCDSSLPDTKRLKRDVRRKGRTNEEIWRLIE
ncbi:putative Protein of unknown function DUF2439 protein [Trachipleistophora hominis]|uniref:5'-3' DNA helicase ZGRF1-like N-terminal domain-containing protein n=1 Tax=Trachipleistophora hominis TaxID=72359 RepID=L7JZ38_TRAHO|nr:putative Protein of unknown function DUF2439 protein [Trachipleistophora hominis]